ncbi:hypothetical protein CC80DRAFT_564228 [Byssothecium circinans]|uniref:Uncharacterized protein n=1 Tax=Byssothecium circinans TaxID=147558 RepID=A0A6A5TSB8_9PLEO|nr:hypothetical protein CC80DRAFT_564228 [Byssothecium circinans]
MSTPNNKRPAVTHGGSPKKKTKNRTEAPLVTDATKTSNGAQEKDGTASAVENGKNKEDERLKKLQKKLKLLEHQRDKLEEVLEANRAIVEKARVYKRINAMFTKEDFERFVKRSIANIALLRRLQHVLSEAKSPSNGGPDSHEKSEPNDTDQLTPDGDSGSNSDGADGSDDSEGSSVKWEKPQMVDLGED